VCVWVVVACDAGNHFTVTLRRVKADAALVQRSVEAVRETGFVNYFGLQRFGTGAAPTHEIGRAILRHDWATAVQLVLQPRPGEREPLRSVRAAFLRTGDAGAALRAAPPGGRAGFSAVDHALLPSLARRPTDQAGALMTLPRNLRLLYLHAYQSMVWNHAASARFKLGSVPLVGDLVMCNEPTTAAPAASAGAASQEAIAEDEFDEGDITVHVVTEADVQEGRFSFEDVVLPLPGFAVIYPKGVPSVAAVYDRWLTQDGVTLPAESDARGGLVAPMPGTYRKVLGRPRELEHRILHYVHDDAQLCLTDYDRATRPEVAVQTVEATSGTDAGGGPDPASSSPSSFMALPPRHMAVQLSFSLPRSSYATMLLRELTKEDSSVHSHRAKTMAMAS
jgi:tRNA pseudouridine13 synthase